MNLLASLLAVTIFGAPQDVAVPPGTLAGKLHVLVLEGNDAVNNVATKYYTTPVVEVLDSNDRPVEAATVTFTLPSTGPGGTFANGRSSLTVKTNVQGEAAAAGFIPNDELGRFSFHVTVDSGGRRADLSIHQTNSRKEFIASSRQRKKISKWWIVAGVAGAAAIAGGIYAAKSGGSSGTQPISVIPGAISVGGPK